MQATLADRKLQTIELLTKLKDEELLFLIEQLLIAETVGDWALALTEQQHSDIREGLSDLDAGRSEDYEAFQERMKLRLP